MWIQNISLKDVISGSHRGNGENTMLIQIVSPAREFPTPKFKFDEVHQFEFLDFDYDSVLADEFKISNNQAKEIVDLLQKALDNELNVVVHCEAGICRSGAVVEIGVMMGFEDLKKFRSPNLLMKHKMLEALGMTYDFAEIPVVEPLNDLPRMFND